MSPPDRRRGFGQGRRNLPLRPFRALHRRHSPETAWRTPHDRARARAAERLTGPLSAAENAWLTNHLTDCPACRAVAAAYGAQRDALRALSGESVVPPRDLWARTATAIEREAGRRGATARLRRTPVPAGALGGLLVVAVVAGVSLLANLPVPFGGPGLPGPDGSGDVPGPATPFPVQARDVAYMEPDEEGRYLLYFAPVERVCPDRIAPCAPLDATEARVLTLNIAPRTVILAPSGDHVVVLARAPFEGGDSVVVVPVGTPAPMISPTPTGAAAPTAGSPAPSDHPAASLPPSDDPEPPGLGATSDPSDPSDPPDMSDPPSDPPSDPSDPPTDPSDPPTGAPEPIGTGAPPTLEPTPSPAISEPIAIATGVVVVGEAAAFSPDGRWFAFSARPSDGSQGPDVYLWRVGEPVATPVTDDHRSVFSAWFGMRLLGSRIEVPFADPAPVDGAPAGTPDPVAPRAAVPFVLDPETGVETPLGIGAGWRPAVSPDGRAAVYWDGTLIPDETATSWRLGLGRLVLVQWSEPILDADAPATEEPTADPTTTGSGAPSASPSASGAPSPSSSAVPEAAALGSSTDDPSFVDELRQLIARAPIGDFDVQWDRSGRWVGIWIGDPETPEVGRLTVYRVVRTADGTLRPVVSPLAWTAALPGFSIGDGRVAWVAPPGEDGGGSQLEVFAWSTDGTGSVESATRRHGLIVVR